MISLKSINDELNDVITTVTNGKNLVSAAINDRGIACSSTDSFDLFINKIKQIPTLLPQNAPPIPTASNITNKSITITSSIDSNIIFNGASYSSPYTFTNLQPNTEYKFYAYNPETSTLLESFSSDALIVKTLDRTVQPVNAPTASNITRNSITITAPIGCKIKYNNEYFTSPYNFINLMEDTEYAFYSYKEETIDYYSAISTATIVKTKDSILRDNSFGNNTLIAGDDNAGYFGKVTGLISGTNLTNSIGLTEGILLYAGDITWLKFVHKGRILYIADRGIKDQIQKDLILDARNYTRGVLIDIGGTKYICRMPRGVHSMAINENNNLNFPITITQDNLLNKPPELEYIIGINNEWINLVMKFTPNIEDSHWDIPTKCMDPIHPYDYSITVGGDSCGKIFPLDINDTSPGFTWRPVLELL